MEIETMIIHLLSSSPMCSSMSMLKDGLRVMCGTNSNDSSPTTVSWWSAMRMSIGCFKDDQSS